VTRAATASSAESHGSNEDAQNSNEPMTGLWPKEHGAYAQLGFPPLTGVIYAGGHPGAWGMAAVAVAGFLAHEPLALLSGLRGVRLQDRLREPARRRLALLVGVGVVGLVATLLWAPPRAWLGALVPAGLALLLLPSLGTRRMKTLPAEMIAVAAFSATVVPLALCDDVSLREAAIAAVAWLLAFVPALFAVHAIKAALRRRPDEHWLLWASPGVAVLCVVGAATGGLLIADARELTAALVPGTVILALSLRPPHPRHLKRVGWALVAANAIALILLLAL
jgi:hypothetical protein